MFDLSGKTALITGSNRGIGFAVAELFAAHGAKVLLHCTKESAAATAALRNIPGSMMFYSDFGTQEGADRLADSVGQAGLSPDILILNASLQIRSAWETVSYPDYEKQWTTNFYSPLRLLQRFVPAMKRRSQGRIVTVGSVQQTMPIGEMAVYAASKSALMNLVLNLAKELAPFGITVNNLAPGTILTDRNREVLEDSGYYAKCRDRIPAGFLGTVDDCKGAFLFLCSEAGRYITGTDLYIDGGKHL